MLLCRVRVIDRFNLIAFSRACVTWQSNLVDSTEENCHEAAQWISQLTADGNTCTLEALQVVNQNVHYSRFSAYYINDANLASHLEKKCYA
jgi:hypothetical protein